MSFFKKCSTFPTHDSKLSPDSEKFQNVILHGIEKRCNTIVLKLSKWGNKGATIEIVRKYLNHLHDVNFNRNHVHYALEWLVKNDVIGKRSDGEEATYFARPSTTDRWARVRVVHRGKK